MSGTRLILYQGITLHPRLIPLSAARLRRKHIELICAHP